MSEFKTVNESRTRVGIELQGQLKRDRLDKETKKTKESFNLGCSSVPLYPQGTPRVTLTSIDTSKDPIHPAQFYSNPSFTIRNRKKGFKITFPFGPLPYFWSPPFICLQNSYISIPPPIKGTKRQTHSTCLQHCQHCHHHHRHPTRSPFPACLHLQQPPLLGDQPNIVSIIATIVIFTVIVIVFLLPSPVYPLQPVSIRAPLLGSISSFDQIIEATSSLATSQASPFPSMRTMCSSPSAVCRRTTCHRHRHYCHRHSIVLPDNLL